MKNKLPFVAVTVTRRNIQETNNLVLGYYDSLLTINFNPPNWLKLNINLNK